jgi:hypothetical protein
VLSGNSFVQHCNYWLNDLTAASGWSWIQTGALCDAQTGELLGHGWMDANGVLQDVHREAAPGKMTEFSLSNSPKTTFELT